MNTDKIADAAVFESTLLGLIAAHQDTPASTRGVIRYLMIGACEKIAEYFKEHDPTPDDIEELYAFARLACPEKVGNAFLITLAHVEDEAASVLDRIETGTAREHKTFHRRVRAMRKQVRTRRESER